MLDTVNECEASDLPKAVTLKTCDFPIVKGNIAGYNVIKLPQVVRRIFDKEGASVVRISSRRVANSLPDFGGKVSGRFSLLPHQDHLDPAKNKLEPGKGRDARRFLILSKRTDGARGSSTLVITPRVATVMLPFEEVWIKDDARRRVIGKERNYDSRFLFTEEQYDRCFDEKGGYERVVAEVVGHGATKRRELAVRLGILGYLMRGSHADIVMEEVVRARRGKYFEERWEKGGVVIIDNRAVFHARLGGNTPPLQRNFGV